MIYLLTCLISVFSFAQSEYELADHPLISQASGIIIYDKCETYEDDCDRRPPPSGPDDPGDPEHPEDPDHPIDF